MMKLKKITAMLLAFCMIISVIPLQANAEPVERSTGEEVTGVLNDSDEGPEDEAPVPGTDREAIGGTDEYSPQEPEEKITSDNHLISNDTYGIPDEALYQGILAVLEKEEDEGFTSEEAETIKELTLTDAGIKSLQGIDNLKNLEYLDVSGNELTDLEGLTWRMELKTVLAANNKIADASALNSAYSLEVLDISDNKLTSLEDINVYYLKELNACSNELTYVSVEHFGVIEKFDISNNKIAKLPDFWYGDTMSAQFDNGKPVVNVSFNRLSKVEIMKNMPEQLTSDDDWVAYNLQGQEAEIRDIIGNNQAGIPDPVLYANILEAADYDKNGILTEDEAEYLESLHVGWSEKFQDNYEVKDLTGIKHLKNLRRLTIDQLKTTDLTPLLELEHLYSLGIYNSDIKNLDTIKRLNLTNLYLDTVNIAELSLDGLAEMTSLQDFHGTIRPEDMQYIVKSKSIDYLNLDIQAEKGSSVLSLAGISGMESLTSLSIYGRLDYEWNDYEDENGEWHYDYKEYRPNVTGLSDLTGCNSLTSIIIHEVDLSAGEDLSVFGTLPELEYLTLGYTGIQDIKNLANLKGLRSLSLYGNQIRDISVLSCLVNSPELDSLYLNGNQISDISVLSQFEMPNNLSTLNLSNNKITDITPLKVLEFYERLNYLYLDNNEISDISTLRVLENNSSVYWIDLSNNKITDISALSVLSGAESLYYLSLSSNQIKDLTPLAALKDCSYFSQLNLAANGLTDITGIEGLVSLTELNVYDNELSTLPDLSALVNLDYRWTYFDGNKLTAEELTAKMPEHLAKNQVWINQNRYDEYEWQEELIEEYDEERILDAINDWGVSSVTVVMEEPEVVSQDIFEAAAETGKTVSFDVTDDEGETVYQWSFDGAAITDPDMEIDLSVEFATEKEEEIKALTGQKDAMYLSFGHHGELPGPAVMTVKVGDKYEDGEIVYLYYYNEDADEIELIEGGLRVTNGYVTFTIYHCSDYFLLDEELEEDGGGSDPGPGPGPGPNPGDGSGNGSGGNNGSGNDDKTIYTPQPGASINQSEIIKALQDDENSGVKITLTAPDKITPDVFRALRDSRKTAVFAVTEDGRVVYQWFFDGKEITDPEMTIDMSIAFESQNKAAIDKLTGGKKSVYLSFAHHGKLPGQSRVTVYVGDTFKDGEVLYPYYYNEKTGELEEVAPNGLLVKGGYVTLTLDHCSDYVLVNEKVASVTKNTTDTVAQSPSTGDNNNIAVLAAILILAGAILIVMRKRRKVNSI